MMFVFEAGLCLFSQLLILRHKTIVLDDQLNLLLYSFQPFSGTAVFYYGAWQARPPNSHTASALGGIEI